MFKTVYVSRVLNKLKSGSFRKQFVSYIVKSAQYWNRAIIQIKEKQKLKGTCWHGDIYRGVQISCSRVLSGFDE